MNFPGCRLASILFFVMILAPGLLTGQVQSNSACNKTYPKKVEKLYDTGIGFFKKGNYTEALSTMKTILSQEPDFTDAYFVNGLIYFKRINSNFRDAKRNFLKVLELCPNYDPYVYYYLVNCETGGLHSRTKRISKEAAF